MSEPDLDRILQVFEEDQAALLENQIERRRETLREALFFLELARPVRDSWLARWLRVRRAVEDYSPFALRQVGIMVRAKPQISAADSQIRAMLAPARESVADDHSASRAPGSRAMAVLDRVAAVLGWWDTFKLGEALQEDPDERAELEAVGDDADADAVGLRDCISRAGWVREKLYEFLRLSERSEASPPRRFLRFRLPDLTRFAGKNLTMIWVLPVVAFVAFGVEAVNSLLRNDPGFTLLAIALAALPMVATRLRILTLQWSVDPESGRVGGEEAAWDLGGRAFRSLRWAAVGPGAGVRRWPRGREQLAKLEELAGETSANGRFESTRDLARGFLTLSAQGSPGIRRAIHLTQLLRLLLYGLWWLLCGLVIRQVTDPNQPFLTSYVILVLLAALLYVAHQIDFVDFLYSQRVRLLLLLAGLAVLLLVLLAKEHLFPWFFLVVALCLLGRWAVERSRYLELLVGCLCLLVAILTAIKDGTNDREVWKDPGDSRLARLAAPAIDELDECRAASEWPHGPPVEEPSATTGPAPVVLMAASGGGSRAAVYTGLTLRRLHADFPEIARQLQAISSVSGGSLANAAYTVRRLEAADDEALTKRLDQMVEALRGDFLRPTLEGATLKIGTSRGRSIETHWQEEGGVALGEWTIGKLIAKWRDAAAPDAPRFPVPIFNTSTLDSHDVVISPLDKAFYTRTDLPTEVTLAEDATWVYDRDGVYGLEDLVPGYDPTLAQAVRASANFPFGFPLVRIATTEPLAFSPLAVERARGTPKTVFLTDGGALSNSGMWPLFNLLSHRCLVDRLRQRGVLLVVVDASKMPVYPAAQKKYGTLWSAIGDQAPIAQALHRRVLDNLETLYGERLAVLQIDLVPDLRHNVLTTWALSNRSFDRLESSFESRWLEKRVHLCGQWQALTGSLPNEPQCRAWRQDAVAAALGGLVDRQRPPLD